MSWIKVEAFENYAPKFDVNSATFWIKYNAKCSVKLWEKKRVTVPDRFDKEDIIIHFIFVIRA